jgi:hypothetical protein
MAFTKKVQGVSLDVHTEQMDVFSSGALVKGRYVFYQFQGQEANQGPYKLQGDNGELYIFIIQDSERVYIDGVMQTRGENQDYIMDYNTGEITFTPQNPYHFRYAHYVGISILRQKLFPICYAKCGFVSIPIPLASELPFIKKAT